MTTCEHRFVYAGVKYEESKYPMPGSSARDRHYFDHYYCERCLEHRYEQLPATNNTYSEPLFKATQKPGKT